MECDTCRYGAYDEENDEYLCALYLDEDEVASLLQGHRPRCRYYRPAGDEYEIVRKQN